MGAFFYERGTPVDYEPTDERRCGAYMAAGLVMIQGYLAHKKAPSPWALHQGYA